MSEFAHPLHPETEATTDRSHGRRIDRLERRSHGPWRNAGDPGQPSCLLTPDPDYMDGVGVRWRRRLGGGCEIQIAVTDGVPGSLVLTLTAGWFVPGEGKIPLTGHNAGGAQAFHVDTATGNVVVGV